MFASPWYTAPLLRGVLAFLGAFAFVKTEKSSAYRVGIFGLIILVAYLQYVTSFNFTSSGFWKGGSAADSMLILFHLSNYIFINSIDRVDLAPKSTKGSSSGAFSTALHHAIGTRGIGAKWQVKNVPTFPSFFGKGSDINRVQFLLRTALIFAWQYLYIDLMMETLPNRQPAEEQQVLFGSGQELIIYT
jgi:hypothetical protein